MSYSVRRATTSDVGSLIPVIRELDQYYKHDTEYSDEMLCFNLNKYLFKEKVTTFLLAIDGESEHIAGFLSYVMPWPTISLRPSIFMKELFICDGHRKHGLGRLLLRALAKEAIILQAARIDWTTDSDNHMAMNFYASLGMHPTDEKVFYRITEAEVADLAEGEMTKADK